MCFSATASFVAGGSLGAAGLFTLRRARTAAQMPLAAIPLLFGVQQAIEGVVWLSFDRPVLNAFATYAYVTFSHLLWPFFLPLAVMMIEPGRRRKKILRGFVLFGLAVSLYLLMRLLEGPVTSVIVGASVVYQVPIPDSPLLLATYLVATCVSCLFSSHRYIRTFGLALFGALAISLWMYRLSFYSVWCFFAAILSLIIYVHLGLREPAADFSAWRPRRP